MWSVELTATRAGGPTYLEMVTDLLQRQRVADPAGGIWEAADMQWWFTRDPHPSDEDAVFWLDAGVPVVAVVFTRWSATRYGCDVLGDAARAPVWGVRPRPVRRADGRLRRDGPGAGRRDLGG